MNLLLCFALLCFGAVTVEYVGLHCMHKSCFQETVDLKNVFDLVNCRRTV